MRDITRKLQPREPGRKVAQEVRCKRGEGPDNPFSPYLRQEEVLKQYYLHGGEGTWLHTRGVMEKKGKDAKIEVPKGPDTIDRTEGRSEAIKRAYQFFQTMQWDWGPCVDVQEAVSGREGLKEEKKSRKRPPKAFD